MKVTLLFTFLVLVASEFINETTPYFLIGTSYYISPTSYSNLSESNPLCCMPTGTIKVSPDAATNGALMDLTSTQWTGSYCEAFSIDKNYIMKIPYPANSTYEKMKYGWSMDLDQPDKLTFVLRNMVANF